jgi:hypothetical protein
LTHRKPGAAETTTNFLLGIWSRYVPGLKGQPTGQTLHQSSLLLVSCADRLWGYVLSSPETGQSPMYEDGRVLDSCNMPAEGSVQSAFALYQQFSKHFKAGLCLPATGLHENLSGIKLPRGELCYRVRFGSDVGRRECAKCLCPIPTTLSPFVVKSS